MATGDPHHIELRRELVPMALWDLHRSLAVGEIAEVVLSMWPEPLLDAVVNGAGFEAMPRPQRGEHSDPLRLRRLRTLADTVGPDMGLLLVGLNPSLHAADAGVGFSGPGNRGWSALREAGLAGEWRDPRRLLLERGVGMTDLVKRATSRASEIDPAEFRTGLARLEMICGWLRRAVWWGSPAGVTRWTAGREQVCRPWSWVADPCT